MLGEIAKGVTNEVLGNVLLRAAGPAEGNAGVQQSGKGYFVGSGAQTDLLRYIGRENFNRALQNKIIELMGGEPREMLEYEAILESQLENIQEQAEGANRRKIAEIEAQARGDIERTRLASQADVIKAEEQRRGGTEQAFLKGYLENVLKRPELENSAVAVELAKGF